MCPRHPIVINSTLNKYPTAYILRAPNQDNIKMRAYCKHIHLHVIVRYRRYPMY